MSKQASADVEVYWQKWMKVNFGSSTLLFKQYETSSFTHLLSLCCLHCSLLQWCCIFLYQVSPASYDLCFVACSLHFWQIAHLQHTKICKKITSIKTVCYKENELVAVCKALDHKLYYTLKAKHCVKFCAWFFLVEARIMKHIQFNQCAK